MLSVTAAEITGICEITEITFKDKFEEIHTKDIVDCIDFLGGENYMGFAPYNLQ